MVSDFKYLERSEKVNGGGRLQNFGDYILFATPFGGDSTQHIKVSFSGYLFIDPTHGILDISFSLP